MNASSLITLLWGMIRVILRLWNMISWLWCTALAPVINDQNLVIMGNNEVIMSINYYLLLPIMDPVIMSNNEIIMSIHYYLLLPIMYLCTKM